MRIAFAVAILVSTAGLPAAARQSSSAHPQRQHTQIFPKPRPETTSAPASLAPQQAVPSPPIVLYREGSLSVAAQNSTLQAVLDAIRKSTGAAVEAPVLEERISVNLGPQPPVQVIAALLQGLHLDYAILGGTGTEDPIHRIIILRKPAASVQAAVTPSPPVLANAAVTVRTRALAQLEETGGDEGVWENDSQPRPQPPGPSSPPPVLRPRP
jgi:hypothetical protein